MDMDAAIDNVIDRAEKGEIPVAEYYASLTTSDPEIFTYLFDDDTRLLMDQEHDYLLFIAMIILEVMREDGPALEEIDLDILEERTEYNWGLLEHASMQVVLDTTREHRAAPLYEILEDACGQEDEHEILSEAACELVFVKCKSLIDAGYPVN